MSLIEFTNGDLLDVRVLERERPVPVASSRSALSIHRRPVGRTRRRCPTFCAAIASSSVSVAPHIANRNPPRSTYCRIFSATAFLSAGNRREAELLRRRQVAVALLDEPRRVAEAEVQLVELAGEVLVVQVQPVVLRQVAARSTSSSQTVVYSMPAYLQRERHGVVPRRRLRAACRSRSSAPSPAARASMLLAGDLARGSRPAAAVVDRLDA